MLYTRAEAEEFIKENDVKFIRLAFCDAFGELKNISIQPWELGTAFDCGIPVDSSNIRGFEDCGYPDLFLVPDASTMSFLPWRPSQGRVVRFFCSIKTADGKDFELDSRKILSDASKKLLENGLVASFGAQCEFYLFKTDEDGEPTGVPFDNGSYLDVAPADRGENIRREICLTLEEMGITPETSHHEAGPGQNEIEFRYSNPLSGADNVTTLKSVVKTVANKNGLYADFSPKPLPNHPGSSFQITVSVRRADGEFDEKLFESFMAGVLLHSPECTLLFNPTGASFMRLGHMKAPKFVSWTSKDRSQLVRVPKLPEASGHKRFELRSPDCMSNPYLAYALVINAGLDGVKNGLSLPEETPDNPHLLPENADSPLKKLPDSLKNAAKLCNESEFVKNSLPDGIIKAYTSLADKNIAEIM